MSGALLVVLLVVAEVLTIVLGWEAYRGGDALSATFLTLLLVVLGIAPLLLARADEPPSARMDLEERRRNLERASGHRGY